MGKNSYLERLAAQPASRGEGRSGPAGAPGERWVRAIWAEDEKTVPIVQLFQVKFGTYADYLNQHRIRLADFDVCPLAGDASRAAYDREKIGDLAADDFVLFFSDALQQKAPVIGSFFGSFTPDDLAQADAPVFWLGAAQKVDLDLWSVGETPMKKFPWKILHHVPPGRFRREDPIALDDEVETAVEQLLKHEKTPQPAIPVIGEKPAGTGFLKRFTGFFNPQRKASDG
jgi:hypothetical protein